VQAVHRLLEGIHAARIAFDQELHLLGPLNLALPAIDGLHGFQGNTSCELTLKQ